MTIKNKKWTPDLGVLILCGLVLAIYGIIFIIKNHGNPQNWVFAFVLAFFVINLYFIWLMRKGKSLPSLTGKASVIITILLGLAAIVFTCTNENKDIRTLIAIIIFCLINLWMVKSYRDKWGTDNPAPDVLFKKLIGIEGLGVIIAILQLFIAYPQLKAAYQSATSNDVKKLQESIERFQTHVDDFIFVDIPDSLVTEEVKQAQLFQKRMYSYSLALVNADWNFEPYQDTAIQSLVKEQTKGKSKEEKELASTYLSLLYYQSIGNRYRANMYMVGKLIEEFSAIDNYYLNHHGIDSVLMVTQIDINTRDEALNQLKKIDRLTTSTNNQSQDLVQKAAQDINNKNKQRVLKDVRKYKELQYKYYSNPVLYEFVGNMDKICLDYIEFLNLIQLKYAYNVDYGSPESIKNPTQINFIGPNTSPQTNNKSIKLF